MCTYNTDFHLWFLRPVRSASNWCLYRDVYDIQGLHKGSNSGMKCACVHACVCFCMFTQLSWIVAELQCISLKSLFHKKWKNVLQDFVDSICKGSGDKGSLFGVTFPRSKAINLLWGKQLHCELNCIEWRPGRMNVMMRALGGEERVIWVSMTNRPWCSWVIELFNSLQGQLFAYFLFFPNNANLHTACI